LSPHPPSLSPSLSYSLSPSFSQSLLQQLFPDISVAEDIPYTSWLDLFEDKAQEYLEHMKNKVRQSVYYLVCVCVSISAY